MPRHRQIFWASLSAALRCRCGWSRWPRCRTRSSRSRRSRVVGPGSVRRRGEGRVGSVGEGLRRRGEEVGERRPPTRRRPKKPEPEFVRKTLPGVAEDPCRAGCSRSRGSRRPSRRSRAGTPPATSTGRSSAPAATPSCSRRRHKFDSGTGWPSFWQPIKARADRPGDRQQRGRAADRGDVPSLRRATSATSSTTPRAPTGLRFCINSLSLKLKPPRARPPGRPRRRPGRSRRSRRPGRRSSGPARRSSRSQGDGEGRPSPARRRRATRPRPGPRRPATRQDRTESGR